MSIIGYLILLAVVGLVVGALARLAVPGPDPMSIWRTIALGILGSVLGGVLAELLGLRIGSFIFSLVGAVVVLLAYRRWVQGRPLTGPGAHRL